MLLLMIPLIAFYFVVDPRREAARASDGPLGPRRASWRRSASMLDPFQVEALDALDAGSSVLVSAPTGAGKTLVAAYAVHAARAAGRKAFYTTPLKALSNQKFADLCARARRRRRRAPHRRRLDPTGAPIVVMTTEVLRNMLLTGSPTARRPRRRRARRGPLPPGPLPGRGVGGGADPHAARRDVRVPVGDGRQRRVLGEWLAHGPRRARRSSSSAHRPDRPAPPRRPRAAQRRPPGARRPARRPGRERRGASHRRACCAPHAGPRPRAGSGGVARRAPRARTHRSARRGAPR